METKPQNYPKHPEHLWDIFYDFTQTPRPSRKEGKIMEYLENLAKEAGLKYVFDKAGNLIIYVPGKNGRENDEPLLIQNHVDMVTDALPGRNINFVTDPLEIMVENGWLTANGTTLGADNGIGCAASLAPIFDKDMKHPPLELLFTVDEETGLNGALGLEHNYLSAKKMLNLDTEEWGSLYIGCAGGIDYELTGEFEQSGSKEGTQFYKLEVSGFVGGHSGVDIHEQRGNALKFLGEFLDEINQKLDISISEIRGGKAHNIIPRDCFVYLTTSKEGAGQIQSIGDELLRKWKTFLPKNDQEAQISIEEHQFQAKVLTAESQDKIIQYLLLFPHGAHSYDIEDRELAGISNNFARFLLIDGKVYTQSSLRFFDRNEIVSIERKIKSLGSLFNLKVESHSEYPSWKPARENPVLEKVKDIYKDMYGNSPAVKAIHAGLECGILRDKIGPIDVVSFGPTITGAHSPDERVNIESVSHFWDLFTKVLAKI